MEKQKPQGNGKVIWGAILALAFTLTAVVLYIMGPTHMSQSMLLYLCVPVLVIGVLGMVFSKPVFGVMVLLCGTAGLIVKELINLSEPLRKTDNLGIFACYAIIIIGALLGILFEILRSNRQKVKALKNEIKAANLAAKENEKAAKETERAAAAAEAPALEAPESPFKEILGLGKKKKAVEEPAADEQAESKPAEVPEETPKNE